jgi:alkanesulfonate monooxygenase SsuD/methylene tetrahydromethanopterin reductase-like flavin-dependent oxidoreductase (luciferase family)
VGPAGVRLDRLEETIALLRAHFGDGLVDVQGTHVHASGFEGVPKPAHGMPPIMIGGGAERVLGIAGREADIVSLNFDNSSGKIGPAGVGQQYRRADRPEDRVDPQGRRRRPVRRPRDRDRGVLHRRDRSA